MDTLKLLSPRRPPAAHRPERQLNEPRRWRWRPLALGGGGGGTSTWTGPSPAAPPPANSTAGLDCLIQPSQTVQVGTASAGVIQSIRVERGDYVRRGQALVQLDSRVERASLAMAREKADALGEAVATRGASELAQAELQRAADLVKENFVSRTFYDRQRAEVEVASGRGQQAEEKRRLAEREVQLASAQLAQRTVVSPVDGVVVERHVSPGEYVEQKPVLRIAQIDPLRVDVLVPAAAFGQINVGDRAQVTPELINKQARTALVSGVDRVIDAASHTFRVRLELANPGGKLPPGLRCKADLMASAGKGGQGADQLSKADKAAADMPVAARPAVNTVPAAIQPAPNAMMAPAPLVAAPVVQSPTLQFSRGQRIEAPSPPVPVRGPESVAIAAVGSVPVKWATQTVYEAPADEATQSTQTAEARPKLQLTWAVVEEVEVIAPPTAKRVEPQPITPFPRLAVAAVR